MASIVGHALGAVTVWEAARRLQWELVPQGRRWYPLPAFLGVLPDLDVIIPMLLGRSAAGLHRGWSHSVPVALILAGCAAIFVWGIARSVRIAPLFAVLAACAVVHPLLDYLMGCGPPVPLLWPFSEGAWLSPVQLIPTAYYPYRASGFVHVLALPATWAGIGLELVSIGPLWLATRVRGAGALACVAASAGGFAITLILYN